MTGLQSDCFCFLSESHEQRGRGKWRVKMWSIEKQEDVIEKLSWTVGKKFTGKGYWDSWVVLSAFKFF